MKISQANYSKEHITTVLHINMSRYASNESKIKKMNAKRVNEWMHRMSQKKKNAKLICCLMYQISLFLNWLFSSPERVWQRNFFTKLKEEWNKEIHQSKFFSLFKTQVIFFLNSKHTVESGGMWIMLNLVFYVFKGKQLAKVKFSCWFQFIKYF